MVFRFRALLFCTILFSVTLSAQITAQDSVDYPFVNWDANHISNGEEGLTPFFEKLLTTQESATGFVTLYHIGDSHIASKAYPNSLAANLQNYFGNAGTDVTANNPAVRKKKKRTVRKKKKKTVKKKTTRKKSTKKKSGKKSAALYQEMDQFYQSHFLPAGDMFASLGSGPLPFPSVNDTIPDPDDFPMPDDEEFPLPSDSVAADTNALTAFNSGTGIRYYAYGDYGKTFSFFAQSELMIRHLKEYKPDLVIISLGTNDVWVRGTEPQTLKQTIDRLVQQITAIIPDASFLFTTAPDGFLRRKRSNPHLLDAQTAVIEYCNEHGYAYWDMFTAMGGSGSMRDWHRSGLVSGDLIHFSPAGYTFIAKLLSDAIIKEYEKFAGIEETDNASKVQY